MELGLLLMLDQSNSEEVLESTKSITSLPNSRPAVNAFLNWCVVEFVKVLFYLSLGQPSDIIAVLTM